MTDLRTAAQQALAQAYENGWNAAKAEPVQEPQLKRIHPLDMPLEVFVEDLSTRPRNIINAEMGYFTHLGDEYIKPPLTVRHLLMFSRKELRKWPNLGKRSLNEIEEMLRNRGLQLWDEHDERSLRLLREHPTYFRAALAEPESFNPDWDRIEPLQENLREHMAEIHRLRAKLAEPCPCGDRSAAECPGEWEPGCDLGNNPKYAKRVNLAEPVQEPVAAWENKYGMKEWEVHALRAGWMPAPPQRKPLTEEEIQELSQQHKFDSRMEKFVRIIERAHGIT